MNFLIFEINLYDFRNNDFILEIQKNSIAPVCQKCDDREIIASVLSTVPTESIFMPLLAGGGGI